MSKQFVAFSRTFNKAEQRDPPQKCPGCSNLGRCSNLCSNLCSNHSTAEKARLFQPFQPSLRSQEVEGTTLPYTLLLFITSSWNRWNGWNNSIGNAADRVPTLFQPFQPSAAHTAALDQFPTPARQQPSTLADGLRVIPSAPEAPTRLPDAPCGREVAL